ncbi:hypothetical protein [Acetobacter lovaniensis]|uniref:Uncharacterized protein n=1 Tax=Acetobacter lovaniensis TaxID=104100 RepID=A0A841QHJ7_9PROT|nr:hypothetical protein [Acetobacter lovaniensis]MBB6458010.1 hypothetical protein [Acetobacter lovaniensis]NHN82265.1 hypothetical protein [Acetobacter lovaniensis]GBQ72932.1 hypothetical protein AA0474_2821 [Acetobacter lovaniensis NRIC 0474]
MPTLTINGRDVDVGDEFLNLSPEQQNATVDEIAHSMGVGKSTQSDAPQHPVFDAARSFVQGFPLVGGFQPKIEAAADTGLSYLTGGATPEAGTLSGGIGERYHQALANISSDQQQFAQQHPALNTGAQVAGGIASTAPLASIAIPSRLAQASGALAAGGRIGLTGLEGAALGGTDAYARGDNVTQGAVMGAVGGAGGQALGEAISGGSSLVRALMRGSEGRAADRAASIVRQLGQSDALSPDSAEAELARLGPAATLADLGPNMQQAARAVASAPGSAQKQLVEALMNRQAQAGQRIEGAMDAAMGPRTNILDSADRISSSRSALASPWYDKAMPVPVADSPELQEIIKTPAFMSALAKANTLAGNEGRSLYSPTGNMGMHGPEIAPDVSKMTLQDLHYIQRAMQDNIGEIKTGAGFKDNEASRSVADVRRKLLGVMDDLSPEYATARGIYSDYSKVAQALADGQKVFSNATTPDMLQRTLAGLGESEKAAFTEGARQQVAQMMGTARNDANAAKALLDKGYNREKMALILGDDAAGGLNNAVDAERAFAATTQAARGGSMTDRNMLAQQIIPGDQKTPVLRSLLNLRFGDAALGAGERLASGAINARNERTRDAIARALLSRDATAFAPVAPTQNQIAPNIAAALIGATLPAERN